MTKSNFTSKLISVLALSSVLLIGCKGEIGASKTKPDGTKYEVKAVWDSNSSDGGNPKTNGETKDENDGKGAGDTKIDLSKSNIVINSKNPQISLTLTEFGTPAFTKIFAGNITNDVLTFANPADVDAWVEPFLNSTHGVIIKSYIETTPHEGINTFVSEVYSGDKLLDGVATSSYIKGGTGKDPIVLF